MDKIRILILEDYEEDYLLVIHRLSEEGLSFSYKVVSNSKDYESALINEDWDIIIADYSLPSFSGLAALLLLKKLDKDIPFILISGAIGEEQAVAIMKEGAADYLNKNNLNRLVPVIKREIKEAEIRRNKKEADLQLIEAHKKLEEKVRQRTNDLRLINDQLVIEIDKKEEVERKLKKTASEFQILANTTPNIIIKVDFENDVRFYNKRFYEFLGMDNSFDEKLDYHEYVHPEDNPAQKISLVFNTERGEFKVRVKNYLNEYRWLLVKYQNEFFEDRKIKKVFLSATDIQDLITAQEKAAEEEKRFKIIQEVSPDGFALLKPLRDNDNNIIDFTLDYLNPAGFKLLRFSKEVIGEKTKNLIPSNLYWYIDTLKNVLENNVITDDELLFDNGEIKLWVRDISVKIDDSIAIVFTDITKRKEIEREREELLENERKARIIAENALKNLEEVKEEYRIMGETIPFGVWKTAADGQILYTSESFLNLLNMSLEEFQEFGWSKRLVPEDVDAMFRKWMFSLTTGKPWDHIHRVIDRYGRINYVLSKGLPVKDKDGFITSWVGLNLDITDKMEIEKELEKTREHLKEVLLRVDDIIIAVDNNMKVNFLNETALKLTKNYREEELIGKNIWDIFPQLKDTLFDKYFNMALADQRPITFEFFGPLNKVWYLVSMYPSKEGMTIVSKNIQDKKRQEDKLRASLKEKEFLIKEVHHRVKNNLQIISSLLRLQSSYIQDPKALDCFADSQHRINSMSIVHEQLYHSRQITSVDIKNYLTQLSNTITSSYKDEIVSIYIETEEALLNIEDTINLGLIVNELVLNSIKHAFKEIKDGKIIVTFKKIDNENALLEVRDNGIGFPDNIDVKNSVSFGLQLVVALTEQMSGKYSIINDNGCCFRIELKLKSLEPKGLEESKDEQMESIF